MDQDEAGAMAARKRNAEERLRLREEFVQIMQQRFLAVQSLRSDACGGGVGISNRSVCS